jgi:hypothetical protein
MYEQCKEILLKEHEAVAAAAALQTLIQTAVLKREWTDFEAHLVKLNEMSVQIAGLERERETLFAGFEAKTEENSLNRSHLPVELAGGDRGRFYTLCQRFSPSERAEIGEIYRGLKLEALKLRLANDAMLEYLGEIRTTMTGFFELAFPDRGGKIYTPRGTPVSHDMRSMVLNHRM